MGKNKKKRHNQLNKEENKGDGSPSDGNKFYAYSKYVAIQKSDTQKFDDNTDLEDENWIREKTLYQQKDSFNQQDNNNRFSKTKFPEEDHAEDIFPQNHEKERDIILSKIEEIDNKKRALSEVEVKPKKSLNSMVSKVQSPFSLVQPVDLTENKGSDDSGRAHGASIKSRDRDSVELWRASDQIDKNKRESEMTEPEQDKDKLLDEWLARGRDNNTIVEDVNGENAETNRVSRSSQRTGSSNRRSDANYDDEDEEEENELHKIHMLQSLQALQYMKKVPIPSIEDIKHMSVFLPKPKYPHLKKTLIFDMDETLIHCVDDIEAENPQVVLDVEFEDGEIVEAGINVRPYAIDCLKAANELFQVIVFTASHKCYADVVLDHLDPTGELIQYRLYRDSCYKTEDNVYIKDLRIIQNREM